MTIPYRINNVIRSFAQRDVRRENEDFNFKTNSQSIYIIRFESISSLRSLRGTACGFRGVISTRKQNGAPLCVMPRAIIHSFESLKRFLFLTNLILSKLRMLPSFYLSQKHSFHQQSRPSETAANLIQRMLLQHQTRISDYPYRAIHHLKA